MDLITDHVTILMLILRLSALSMCSRCCLIHLQCRAQFNFQLSSRPFAISVVPYVHISDRAHSNCHSLLSSSVLITLSRTTLLSKSIAHDLPVSDCILASSYAADFHFRIPVTVTVIESLRLQREISILCTEERKLSWHTGKHTMVILLLTSPLLLPPFNLFFLSSLFLFSVPILFLTPFPSFNSLLSPS
jgi:hypothetical protein